VHQKLIFFHVDLRGVIRHIKDTFKDEECVSIVGENSVEEREESRSKIRIVVESTYHTESGKKECKHEQAFNTEMTIHENSFYHCDQEEPNDRVPVRKDEASGEVDPSLKYV
jgi:hypothetical protein